MVEDIARHVPGRQLNTLPSLPYQMGKKGSTPDKLRLFCNRLVSAHSAGTYKTRVSAGERTGKLRSIKKKGSIKAY